MLQDLTELHSFLHSYTRRRGFLARNSKLHFWPITFYILDGMHNSEFAKIPWHSKDSLRRLEFQTRININAIPSNSSIGHKPWKRLLWEPSQEEAGNGKVYIHVPPVYTKTTVIGTVLRFRFTTMGICHWAGASIEASALDEHRRRCTCVCVYLLVIKLWASSIRGKWLACH